MLTSTVRVLSIIPSYNKAIKENNLGHKPERRFIIWKTTGNGMNNPIPSSRRSKMLKTPRMLSAAIMPISLIMAITITAMIHMAVMLKATGKSRASLKNT